MTEEMKREIERVYNNVMDSNVNFNVEMGFCKGVMKTLSILKVEFSLDDDNGHISIK